MVSLREKALEELLRREPSRLSPTEGKISDIFGINVFDRIKMKQYLSEEAFESVIAAVDEGRRIDRKIANQVAAGMKVWALERGASHYTHWFHPLTDSTAEKHDAFFELQQGGGAIERFRGELLVQQEPDASSFPSGGLRNTFEARGYTAWDPSSPAFVLDGTLCIPTVFISYTGEALDLKTPHLRSLLALDTEAAQVCQLFDKDVKKVNVTLGWEQEYFLVDEGLFIARPDLLLTGRTLMGHVAAKDQQLEDHYFGSIPDRIGAFMKEMELESYKLSIPVKTRHNEVAPHQFECAPIFEEANLAVDHNLLLMSVMDKVARRHKLRVLFHEKPFKGVNGSGKHCNWSMATHTGVNLLSPGKNPRSNIQFLTFLVNTMKAVDTHGMLLLASVASQSNSHRLGANEAPPAIMSVFIGTTLSAMLDSLEERVSDKKMTPGEKTEIKLDIGKIPEILLDNTDRNRTSPFAFTGNRFELRAMGSSGSAAAPLIALNTAVAEQLHNFRLQVEALIEKGVKKDEAILQVLRTVIAECKKIRFEGNGYSQEWQDEATKRGLPMINDVPTAFKSFLSPGSVKMFNDYSVLSERELESRFEIRNETFVKKLQIEARVLGDLAINHVVPTALEYQNVLIENVKGLKELFPTGDYLKLAETQLLSIRKISEHIRQIRESTINLVEKRKEINQNNDVFERATLYSKEINPVIEDIRYHIDKLELIVDDKIWPLPKYRELLFLH
ncbi:glutamine synthetase III family protein [Williamwhitmania taraxaci]|uniref:Glutamine synthetase n=1 Tax=Williamwhitmania taraxaci TaxID=1640674 RepID=A0A1G6ITU2_9BACT|nr:glutamine synthetase III [Williamwhitmania taraxaci]SDC09874.1 glutamine synthetase [Williamwhitmania taraxaci]